MIKKLRHHQKRKPQLPSRLLKLRNP